MNENIMTSASTSTGAVPPLPKKQGISLPPKTQPLSLPPRNHLLTQIPRSQVIGHQPRAQGSRKSGARVFKRQNSFAGFPSASLSIFSGTTNTIKDAEQQGINSLSIPQRINKTENSYVNIPTVTSGITSSQHLPLSIHFPLTQTTNSVQTNSSKPKRVASTKVFYSLPRHATTPSNPALLKASASGLGLYFMARNEANAKTSKKPSAAEQLGVSPAKFLSLPRPKKKTQGETTIIKIPVYRSLPRPIKHGETSSIKTSEAKTLTTNSQSYLARDPADGKEADPKPKKRENENFELQKKVNEPPIPKEKDPKYHPRSRTVVKNDSWVPPTYPKRDIYSNFPYRRLVNDDYGYQPLPRQPEKDPLLYYYHSPYDKANLSYRSFPRSGREIFAYQAMVRRPDGEEYSAASQPLSQIPDLLNYTRGSLNRPVYDPYTNLSYHQKNYTNRMPVYQHQQTSLPRGPIENNVYSIYKSPPPHSSAPYYGNRLPELVSPSSNKSIGEQIVYHPLPRNSGKVIEPHFSSLPRKFGRENELRFYAKNIDISEDPGYESLLKSVNTNQIKGPIANHVSLPEGKENEPKLQPSVKAISQNSSMPLDTMQKATFSNVTDNSLIYSALQDKSRGKQIDSHHFSKRRDDKKFQSLPKKDARESELRYQSLLKNSPKENYEKLQVTRENNNGRSNSKAGTKSESQMNIKVDESKNNSGKKLDDKENKNAAKQLQSQVETDEEDGLYSTVKTRKEIDPIYQSVPEVSYVRPLPPVPAPSKYKGRSQESEENVPPPLPPPRLTTGPVGPHNPLLNVTLPHSISVANKSVPSRPNVCTTPSSSSPENNSGPKNLSPTFKMNEEEDPYSSIPSPSSPSKGPPASTLPRSTAQAQVPPSKSWDSLEASKTSQVGLNVKDKKRRRAGSDPRITTMVLLQIYLFTVYLLLSSCVIMHAKLLNKNFASALILGILFLAI